MTTYEKPIVKDFSYLNAIGTCRLVGIDRLRVFKMLLKWRDYIARVEDESRSYILPSHILREIAQNLPRTMNELKDCLRSSAMPPALEKHAKTLLEMIDQKLKPKKNKHIEIQEDKKVSKPGVPNSLKEKVKTKYSYLSSIL